MMNFRKLMSLFLAVLMLCGVFGSFSVITVLGTVVGMVFIMFLAVLFTTLVGKIVGLVTNLVTEIQYRL